MLMCTLDKRNVLDGTGAETQLLSLCTEHFGSVLDCTDEAYRMANPIGNQTFFPNVCHT